MIIRRLNNQTNVNLSLQGYGSINRLVKLCKDNGITNINNELKSEYSIEERSIDNKKNTGYLYVKKASKNRFIVTENSKNIITEDSAKTIEE